MESGIVVRIPNSVSDLVRSGVITVSVYITADGTELSARAVQPHPKLGVQTNTNYDMATIARVLRKVDRVTSQPKVKFEDEVNDQAHGLGSSPFTSLTLNRAKEIAAKHDLLSVTRNGIKNQLPSDSLSWWDLMRSDPKELAVRALLVAEKIGTPKIVSRIHTAPDKLGVVGARDLNQWWEKATPEQRFRCLTTSSRLQKPPHGNSMENLSSRFAYRLAGLQCPFRNAETPLDQAENRDEEDSDDSYGGIVTF